MKITMTKDADVTVPNEKGQMARKALFPAQHYELPSATAQTLIDQGAAEPWTKSIPAPPEDKAVTSDEVEDKGEDDSVGSGVCTTCKRKFADVDRHKERTGH